MKIDKKIIEYLANLSKISLSPQEENKLIIDLKTIIEYFNELSKVDNLNIEEMTGSTNLKNILREDDIKNPYQNMGKESFPKKEGGFLSVPKTL